MSAVTLDHIGELPEVQEYKSANVRAAMWVCDADIKLRFADAALAAADREVGRLREEATDLLDAIFQTVDPEEGEDIVAEAWPQGGPRWVLDWYSEHPNEEEVASREGRGTP